MKKNVGKVDKITRIVVALVLPILFVTGLAPGVFGYAVLVIGGILLLTALVDFCPFYSMFGFNSDKNK